MSSNISHRRWTRRPTWRHDDPDDWIVLRDGVDLGRVHRAPYIEGAPDWWWGSWTYPGQQGTADTLEEALERCRAAIGDKPVPEWIERARRPRL